MKEKSRGKRLRRIFRSVRLFISFAAAVIRQRKVLFVCFLFGSNGYGVITHTDSDS